MKKTLLAIALALALALTCGAALADGADGVSSATVETDGVSSATAQYDAVSSATLDVTEIPRPGAREGASALVVYFSTDDTLKAAAVIAADALDAELFELTPAEPYTAADLNYSDSASRATAEQRDPAARPAIAALPEGLEKYDTVLLGYPIWWGQAPKIMYTFIESVDLSGKTIVPFCTSGSSPAGSSAANLRAVAAFEADWLDAQRISNRSNGEDIWQWARALPVGREDSMQLMIDGTAVTVTWETNDSVTALKQLAADGLTLQLHRYGGFEQVGPIGRSLPRADVDTATAPGDIVLYSGDQLVVFFGSNSWAYTRLGHIDGLSGAELSALLDREGVEVTLAAQ